MRILQQITIVSVFLISIQANAIPITAGDIVRVDFASSDWMFGTGDPNLSSIGPRIGFCGVPAFSFGDFSGDADCDATSEDSFRLSIFSTADVLLYSGFNISNGSVSPNTWANNLSRGGNNVFPRDGYILFEMVAGALDFNEILLLGSEVTPPSFGIQTGLLDFVVTSSTGNSGGGGSTTIPESGTLGLLGLGLLGLAIFRRKST